RFDEEREGTDGEEPRHHASALGADHPTEDNERRSFGPRYRRAMHSAGSPPETVEDPRSVRRRRVPTRLLADKVIVARPADGAPVVLAPTAALVWDWLDDWTCGSDLDERLSHAFPDVAG